MRFLCWKKRHAALPYQRQKPFHFHYHLFPFPMEFFRRLPMAGTPLLFGLASQMEGKVQLATDVISEFNRICFDALV